MEEKIDKSEKKDFISKTRSNPWMFSTFVLGIIVIVLLFSTFSGRLTGGTISDTTAADNLISFLNQNAPSEVVLKDVSSESGLYKVNVDYQGNEIPLYVTKDGKYFIQGVVPLSSSDSTDSGTKQTDVPKTTKPSVELYVFTYCPYGLQMEKAFAPVVTALGSKIDFKIRQIGAMHGEYEKQEAIRQLCIEKEYPDKFLQYVNAFALDTKIGACGGKDECVLPLIDGLYKTLGIDKAKITSCISSKGASLYSAEEANSKSKGVSGSPTLIINGVETQASRSPDAVKTAICSAFTTAPSECSQALSTTAASPGFGVSTSTASTSTAAQC
jgi:glutaredoxin